MSGHVLITGAAGGIGAALAAHFAGRGWTVTALDLAPFPSPLAEHPDIATVTADVTDEAAMETAMQEAAARAPLTAVIANAAVTDLAHHHAVDLPYETWRKIMRVNVDGGFLTARCAARHMPEGGNIVFVTSSLARLSDAQAGDAPYCTSKAAIEMLARVLALELRPRRINVNTLFPSVMLDTGFFAHLDAARRAELAPPSLLDATAEVLCTLSPGSISGRSLDQQAWDDDPAYRTTWKEPT
ncbi:predicted dehydrogenase [Oceanicola granulosus HTCC2516]|uniref:Predicted dehydrogenase n=1 Tax=Oceanicola granulosus (strain ATCC BAA-861 / DSM 15982 / KCTC 12143 / HTCC2516) TaxID=314256 RepID=Q2CAE4_OCEGH|nr:SDR family oxidoreductase [Oceanicola granulosus]EAR49655.1 predicted dehydrogenase [Oceanicola granulosus HTCC2516]